VKNKKKFTALVTGGAGFIGSHLTELLVEKNFKVTVLDDLSNSKKSNILKLIKDNKIKFINNNITNKKINSKIFNVNFIFHLAAIGSIVPSIDQPVKYIENNFNGTINILEKIKKYKIKKFIYAASSSCYGLNYGLASEKSNISTQYPYAFSKWIAEEAIKHWSKVYNIPYVSIRIFNAYGPRFQTRGAYGSVIGVFLRQKYSDKPLTVVGNGKQSRDYVHVKDVANAFYLSAIKKQKNIVYNLGCGKSVSVNSIVKIINPKKIVKIPNRPGEPFKILANNIKIKKILGWKPRVSFNDGLKGLLSNLKEWKDAPLWDKKSIKIATKNWFKHLK
jgi:UDP-glucose 4-epimerase